MVKPPVFIAYVVASEKGSGSHERSYRDHAGGIALAIFFVRGEPLTFAAYRRRRRRRRRRLAVVEGQLARSVQRAERAI